MLSLENLHTIFGNSPQTCIVLFPDAPRFTIAYANPKYLQATNRAAEDLIGKGIFEAFPDSVGDIHKSSDIKKSLEQVLASKSGHKSSLFRYNMHDFESKTIEPHFWISETYPLLNTYGSIEYIVRSPLDVTQFITEEAKNPHPGKLLMKDADNPIFHNHPDAVFTLDLEGRFLNVNKQLVQIVECPEAELLKMSFHRFIAEEDLQLMWGHFNKSLGGEIQHFNARAISAKGKHLILDITHLPVIINSEVVGVYIIAKDVTAIKKAEQQLEAYHHRIANILESVTDGFLALDKNFIVTYWNKEAERILCRSREDAMGKNLWDIYPEAVSQKFYSEYHRAINMNTSIQFQEHLAVVDCWLEVTAYPSEDGLSVYFKDISERIKAEEQLKQAKEQYQTLFDLSPIPNWVFDVQTLEFLDVNRAATEQYGYRKDEFLAMTLKDIRASEDVPELLHLINKEVMPNKNSKGFSHHLMIGKHTKRSGEIINVEVIVSAISFQGKAAMLALVIDITERLKSAQELSVSEQRFKALVQEGSDMIQIIDEHGYYSYVSPNTNRVLEQVFQVGDKAFASLLEPDRLQIIEVLSNLKNGECVKLQPVRCKDKNDQIQWMEITLTNLKNDPAVNGVVANSRNVTKQINDALKIKESVEQYDIVSEATNDAIYEWNLSANYLRWNKGFEVLFGHDISFSDDVERWVKMLHPEDKEAVTSHLHAVFEAREPKITLEYRFQCADGSYKHVLDRGYLIYNEAGEPIRIIGALQDVTDRINYIHRLEEKNIKLSEISWLQSHVVRAPLAQVMGLSELLSVDEQDEERQVLLRCLRNSAAELDHVIRNIIRKTEDI